MSDGMRITPRDRALASANTFRVLFGKQVAVRPMPVDTRRHLSRVEMVDGWWPGVPRRCTRVCRGWLECDPPCGMSDGRLYCLSCGREPFVVSARGWWT